MTFTLYIPYSGIFLWGRVFRDTEPFHEYLTHKNLLSRVEFAQYRLKNETLTHEN